MFSKQEEGEIIIIDGKRKKGNRRWDIEYLKGEADIQVGSDYQESRIRRKENVKITNLKGSPTKSVKG